MAPSGWPRPITFQFFRWRKNVAQMLAILTEDYRQGNGQDPSLSAPTSAVGLPPDQCIAAAENGSSAVADMRNAPPPESPVRGSGAPPARTQPVRPKSCRGEATGSSFFHAHGVRSILTPVFKGLRSLCWHSCPMLALYRPVSHTLGNVMLEQIAPFDLALVSLDLLLGFAPILCTAANLAPRFPNPTISCAIPNTPAVHAVLGYAQCLG